MAVGPSDLESFHKFIGEKLENGGSTMTAEEALQSFRAYQHDLQRLHEHLQKSEGDPGRKLDDEALKDRIRRRLAQHGVTD